MQDSARQIAEALRSIPCIGDGDTGYGNAVNVKRTVKGYAQVGLLGGGSVGLTGSAGGHWAGAVAW
jgi:2-methylisocitrate lyase-like PEP mutase family enzyme